MNATSELQIERVAVDGLRRDAGDPLPAAARARSTSESVSPPNASAPARRNSRRFGGPGQGTIWRPFMITALAESGRWFSQPASYSKSPALQAETQPSRRPTSCPRRRQRVPEA